MQRRTRSLPHLTCPPNYHYIHLMQAVCCCPSSAHRKGLKQRHTETTMSSNNKSAVTVNSIAFGSAPRREVDSQPFSPCARPAVSQTETHTLGFLSVADASPSSGATLRLRSSSGRMVMRPTSISWVSGSYPGLLSLTPPPPPPPPLKSQQTRIRTTDRKLCVGCLTIGPAVM